MIATHIATGQQWAVVAIPDQPALIELVEGQHLSTTHPFTIHGDYDSALAAILAIDPDYEPEANPA